MNAGSGMASVNPFSPTAVARVAEFGADDVTIDTGAIRQVLSSVDDYLAATRVDSKALTNIGRVLAIVGDYGTGKTHLVMRLLRHVSDRGEGEAPAQAIYLDATAETFLALHRRFMERFELSELNERVSEYYADVIADSLDESPLTTDVAQWLRRRKVEPEQVVEQLDLMESALLRQVQQELNEVTRNGAFSTALTLLLRDGFDQAVWRWLSGGPPEPILAQRGIRTAIDSEATALEAMGVFALLYGHKGRRFVLAIDELERVLSTANRPRADASAAFQKLLSVFTAADAFLVLSGLPEFLQVLPDSVRQRIGQVVAMPGLNADEVRTFIERSQEQAFGDARLEPFTEATVDAIVRLSGGAARPVIRLCHHLYRRATDAGALITEDMVREAAREHLILVRTDDVGAEMRRRLRAGGWSYMRDHRLGPTPDSRVEYWVTAADGSAGCAVLLTGPVLDRGDLERLSRRASAVRAAAPDSGLLLVVNGVLPDEFLTQLRGMFSAEPLVYDRGSFAEDFNTALAAVVPSPEQQAAADPLTVIREGVERITRQQSETYGFIEQLTVLMDGIRSSSDRRLRSIQRDLDRLVPVALAAQSGEALSTRREPLPAEVAQHFDDALAALDELIRPEGALLDEAFMPHEDDLRRLDNTRTAIQTRLRSGGLVEATGAADSLRRTVLAFRAAVSEWYAARAAEASDDPLSATDKAQLNQICQTYDDISEFLGTSRLAPLSRSSLPRAHDIEQVEDVTQAQRRSELQTAFYDFSVRVRQAVLQSVSASGR